MFTPKRSAIKSLSLYYLLQKAYFEVQDLLAIMEPVLSHYSFLFLQSKYTWPPFKTFDDLWLVISMILYSIMSAFFFLQQLIIKRAHHETAHCMRNAACFSQTLSNKCSNNVFIPYFERHL